MMNKMKVAIKSVLKPKRQWSEAELIYLICKNGGVIQLGKEEKFVDYYFNEEKYVELGTSREELIQSAKNSNQLILKTLEKFYAEGVAIDQLIEYEAAKRGMSVKEMIAVSM